MIRTKPKLLYTENYCRKNQLPMTIWVRTVSEGEFSTDQSGETELTGRHLNKEYTICNSEGHEIKRFVYTYEKRALGTRHHARLEKAKSWMYKFRHLNEEKNYHPTCHNLNDERTYPPKICPHVRFKDPTKPAQCNIRPNAYGYGGGMPRDLPLDRRCDLGHGAADLMNEELDPISGFTMRDYWDCATKRKINLIVKQEEPEDA